MDEGETIVYCQRCGRPGGKVAYGWAILCKQCRGDDDSEWFDQNKGKQWKIKTVLTAEAREHKATSTSSGAITPNAVGTGSTSAFVDIHRIVGVRRQNQQNDS